MSDAWPSLFRIVVGIYWLYFASQKWHGVGWVQSVMTASAQSNPIPGLHQFLAGVVVPNWFLFAVGQTVGETLVAIFLILGLATRWAAILGLLLALNLAVIATAQVIASGAGRYAVAGFKWVPAYLR